MSKSAAQPEARDCVSKDPAKDIRVHPVVNRAGLDQFIGLPWKLYRKDPNWVPPLRMERRQHLDPRHNPYFDRAEAQLFLALRGGQVVGRITAQIDRAYLQQHGDGTGHFGFLEALDEPAIFDALLGNAEAWLRDKGMRRLRGPFSFSINEESGLLVEGFEKPPYFLMGHALPYYGARMEGAGYTKAKDLVAYHFPANSNPVPASARAMIKRLKQDPRVSLRTLSKKRFNQDMTAVLQIFNDAWSENWGFVPLSDSQLAKLAKDLKLLIREDFVAIAAVDGKPAAFAVSLPNLNEAIADLNGSLLPFGWAKLIYRVKAGKIRSARMPLMGVRRKFHGTPLGAAMAFAVIDLVHRGNLRHGITEGELSWVLEDNHATRSLIEAGGARPYKIYRIYEKDLR